MKVESCGQCCVFVLKRGVGGVIFTRCAGVSNFRGVWNSERGVIVITAGGLDTVLCELRRAGVSVAPGWSSHCPVSRPTTLTCSFSHCQRSLSLSLSSSLYLSYSLVLFLGGSLSFSMSLARSLSPSLTWSLFFSRSRFVSLSCSVCLSLWLSLGLLFSLSLRLSPLLGLRLSLCL